MEVNDKFVLYCPYCGSGNIGISKEFSGCLDCGKHFKVVIPYVK